MPDLVDVVVVGAGIMGCAITLALARRNQRVLLLEQHHPGYGATGTGFAWVNATYKSDNADYFRLNAEGVAKYDRLASEWGSERSGIYGGGSLFWTHPTDASGEHERLRQMAHRLQSLNYPVSLLTGDELRVLEPALMFPANGPSNPNSPSSNSSSSISSNPISSNLISSSSVLSSSVSSIEPVVLFAPNDKWVDTRRLCKLFIEQARLHKAEIRTNSPVLGFTRTASNAISTVETPQGRISTYLLVLAGGIATPGLVSRVIGNPAAIPRIPVREEPGLLVETPPLAEGRGCNRLLYPPDLHGLHMRPTPQGGLLIGADDTDAAIQRWLHNEQRAETNVAVNREISREVSREVSKKASREFGSDIPAEIWQPLLDRVAHWLPEVASAEVRAHCRPRICIRPVPGDGLPVIGTLDEVPGTYIAVTHSGITLAPLLADMLAAEIFTRQPVPATLPYRPARFR